MGYQRLARSLEFFSRCFVDKTDFIVMYDLKVVPDAFASTPDLRELSSAGGF